MLLPWEVCRRRELVTQDYIALCNKLRSCDQLRLREDDLIRHLSATKRQAFRKGGEMVHESELRRLSQVEHAATLVARLSRAYDPY